MKILSLLRSFFIFFFLSLLAACSEQEGFERISDDEATQKMLEQERIVVSERDTSFTLSLLASDQAWTVETTAQTDSTGERWCSASVRYGTAIDISIQPNTGFASRTANIILTNGDKSYKLTVVQRYKTQMQPLRAHVDVEASGTDAYVFIKTNVKPAIDIPSSVTWLKADSFMVQKGTGTPVSQYAVVVYHLVCDVNTGLGRAATLRFTAKGAVPVTVTVHQWPGTLRDVEDITVSEPGTLGTLVGGNAVDWSHVRMLRLSGTLNNADIETLRAMLCPTVRYIQTNAQGNFSVATPVNLSLRHVDLGRCKLIGGGAGFDEPSIETGLTTTYNCHGDNCLGDNAFFITRTPLESIVLPAGLETIGGWLFSFCENLTKIDIPASVKHIGPNAFFNCSQLGEINIPADSRLETIGYRAFDTGKRLKDISFPASLVLDEFNSFPGNFNAERIHVKWPVPPVLQRLRVNSTSTLYVPRGCGDLYRQAVGWKYAKEVMEE